MERCGCLLVLGLSLALTAGCGDNLKPGQSPPPPQDDAGAVVAPVVVPWVRFAPTVEAAEAGRFRRGFPLRGQRDIIAVVAIPDAPGARMLRFEIVGPTGTPYNTIWQAFATADGAPETITHPETGSPEVVQRFKVEQGTARVLINIAVDGSHISRHALTGTFNVAVHLDGSEPICVGSFDIRRTP
jgi:hypothetical protein